MAQEKKPKLASKHTGREVLDCFVRLITKRAAHRMGEPLSSKPVRCPTTIMRDQP
uniref:Uncharacterized protein n=1 Tax=Arundo donax TaxID=35708 RepID=A0A0A9BZC5_ARUDO